MKAMKSKLSRPLREGEKLAAILERIRKYRICAYMGSVCDCKFGAENIEGGCRGAAGNGCPEMRDAIHLLRSMTDAEFRKIRDRKQHGS